MFTGDRLEALAARAAKRRLDAVLVFDEANVRALTGVVCDNACVAVGRDRSVVFFTDFRYVPAVRRTAPELKVVDGRRDLLAAVARHVKAKGRPARLGYEGSIAVARYLELVDLFPRAKFIDVSDEIERLRSVKTVLEIAALAAAEALNDEIWARAKREFRPGQTEKDMQRIIRAWMNALGDGEAFETIVCAGANAAECHHVPDDTVWRRGDPLLVDMGVKREGFCSDMTRCVKGRDAEYLKAYDVVLEANRAAIAACRPGLTGRALDAVARKIIRKAGYGRCFGHSLGHGVGYEIHEAPTAGPRSDQVLEPGMTVTIEPGIYVEGRFGIRVEDLVVVTDDGCDVLSRSAK